MREAHDDEVEATNGLSARAGCGTMLLWTYPAIFASSSSACSLKTAILFHGLSLSFSLLGDESDLYTMPVLSSTKTLTFLLAASLPTARDRFNDLSL